jgi:hypothetical protein
MTQQMMWIPLVHPKYKNPESKVRKPRRNDIEWSNLWGDQATHFTSCTKRPSVDNSTYNCKNVGTTYNVGPIICVSSSKKMKTQVGWVIVVRWRAWRWTKANNTPPNGSPYHVPTPTKWLWDPHVGKFEKNIVGVGVRKIVKQMEIIDTSN